MNDILNKAEDGAKDMYNPGWYYKYVPTNDALSSAISPNNRTKTPVEDSPSEFIGKSMEELAATLISAPKEVDLNRQFFAVLDKRSEGDGSLVLCHVVENGGSGNGDVDWLRCWPKNSSLNLRGMSMMSPTWGELKSAWERKKKNGVDVVDWECDGGCEYVLNDTLIEAVSLDASNLEYTIVTPTAIFLQDARPFPLLGL